MNNQLLPVGSVITLTGATKKLLIIGITAENSEDNKIYDYIGVPFPEGFIDTETMFLFYHKDIEVVNFIGYVDAESQAYRIELAKHLKENGIITEEE